MKSKVFDEKLILNPPMKGNISGEYLLVINPANGNPPW